MTTIVNYPNLSPGVCLICESSKHQRHIDTNRNIRGVHPLSGRKYICEDCIREFADKLGYTSPELTENYKHLINVAQEEAAEAKLLAKAVEDLKDPLVTLANKLPDKNKPRAKAPRKTKVVKDEPAETEAAPTEAA